MRFRVLGPVEVWAGATALRPPGLREHKLLAMLLLNTNRTVAFSRLIDALWDDEPPATARAQVQNCLSALRRHLISAGAPVDVLTRGRGGYLLHVDEKLDEPDLDLLVFNRLVARARVETEAGDRATASALLRDALGLWQGPALAGLSGRVLEAEAARLEERRAAAAEDRLELELQAGHHHWVLDELTVLVADNPLRERPRELLMRTLYRAGRRAEALAAYQEVREVLATELGIEPSPALKKLHRQILDADPALDAPSGQTAPPAGPGAGTTPLPGGAATAPAPATIPRELPPDIASFTGRRHGLEQLAGFLAHGDRAAPATSVIAITGTPGVGKTALAVHWAHLVADRFPDGQLFVKLHGHSLSPTVPPVEALARLLRALGVPTERLPVAQDELAAMFRTLVAGKRMLIVLDDAATVDQVRPLLPASPTCLVLVTSRNDLLGLALHDAHRLTLDVLSTPDALALLRRILGTERISAERDAAGELVRLCAHLPLALRVAAANLAGRPHTTIGQLVAEFDTGDRLEELALDGDHQYAVRLALDLSYLTLPSDARLLLRRLGLVPGAEFSQHAAAALLGAPHERARRLLDVLAAAHLVEQHAPGRFHFHDLLRLYGRQRAQAEDTAADRDAAVCRLFDFYLRAADSAVQILNPGMARLARPPATALVPTPEFAGRTATVAWFDAERPNLVAAALHAAEHGPRRYAWHLADSMRSYFFTRRSSADWLTTSRAGLLAACGEADLPAQAAMHRTLALAHFTLGDHIRSIDHYNEARTLFQRTADEIGEAGTLSNLGLVHRDLGHLDEAIDLYRRARLLYERVGDRHGQAIVLNNLGNAYRPLGRLADAVEQHAKAAALCRQQHDAYGEAVALNNIGVVHREMGNLEDAADELARALALFRQIGDRNGEASGLDDLSQTFCAAGRYAEALDYARNALALARDTTDPRTEVSAMCSLGTVRERLGDSDDAVALHEEALRTARRIEYRIGEARALCGLASALCQAGRYEQALERGRAALEIAEPANLRTLALEAHAALAAVHLGTERYDAALEHCEQTMSLLGQTGYRLGGDRIERIQRDASRRARNRAGGGPEPAG